MGFDPDIVATAARATIASRVDRLDSALEPNKPDKPLVWAVGNGIGTRSQNRTNPKSASFSISQIFERGAVAAGGAEAPAIVGLSSSSAVLPSNSIRPWIMA
jgi:hypothetical protein